MMLASRLHGVSPSATKVMSERAAALRASGRRVITLSQGEPDFDTPPAIRSAAMRAISDGHTRYGPVAGLPALREAIGERLRRDQGLAFGPDQVTVGCGAKQVIFNALLATLDAGDEVVIPAPCWVSYQECVRLAGGTPVLVPCGPSAGFKLDAEALEAALSSRTRWLILNSPGNPTGAVYRADELAALADVLTRHPDVWVLSDEIYDELVYADAPCRGLGAVAPQLSDRLLIVNGVSKAHAMTGWRVGYGAGPARLVRAMNTIQGHATSHPCTIAQHAALEAVTGDQAHVAAFREAFRVRRDLVVARLAGVPGLSCSRPDGAFYVFPWCAGLIGAQTREGRCLESDTDVAMFLLVEAGVAVVPGAAFAASPFLRVSFASDDAVLREACDRIAMACASLSRATRRAG